MPRAERDPDSLEFPVKCPASECDAEYARLVVRSRSIVTLCCVRCRFVWSVETAALSPPLLHQLGLFGF